MVQRDEAGVVKSNETLFAIVDYLSRNPRGRIVDIADELGVSNSTVHRHLTSLREHEYVRKEDGAYCLGYRFLNLGSEVRQRRDEHTMIQSRVDEIANETGEITAFIAEEFGKAVFLYRRRGEHAAQTDVRVGSRVDLLDLGAGPLILAFSEPEERERIRADIGIDDEWESMREELESVRDLGFALDRGTYIEGLRTVSAPVHGREGDLLGAISIAGPAHRLRGEKFTEELPNYLLSVINEYELDIRYS